VNIRPCPFCGDDDPLHDEISPDVYAVICGTCGTIGPSYHGATGGVSAELEDLVANATIEQAVDAWNSRAIRGVPADE
jgi:Lar family restriction alleviation protein